MSAEGLRHRQEGRESVRRCPSIGGTVTQPESLTSTEDIVAYLTEQHELFKSVLPTVLQLDGAERAERFQQVRALLAVHEALEQEVIHPKASLDAGEQVMHERLNEEAAAEKAIT